MKPTNTRDDLKKWTARATMHLDFEDGYSNHYQCNEEPRLTYIDSGPRSRYWGGEADSKVKQKHKRTFYVDGIECTDIDAVLTMLNAKQGE